MPLKIKILVGWCVVMIFFFVIHLMWNDLRSGTKNFWLGRLICRSQSKVGSWSNWFKVKVSSQFLFASNKTTTHGRDSNGAIIKNKNILLLYISIRMIQQACLFLQPLHGPAPVARQIFEVIFGWRTPVTKKKQQMEDDNHWANRREGCCLLNTIQ